MAKTVDAQKVEGKGGEEDRECDARTVLGKVWKEREENENNSKR